MKWEENKGKKQLSKGIQKENEEGMNLKVYVFYYYRMGQVRSMTYLDL